MKIISLNAILIAATNVSLLLHISFNSYSIPPLSLLSLVYIILLVLLENGHRSHENEDIEHDAWLFRKYLYLFGVGLLATLLYQTHEQSNPESIKEFQGSLFSYSAVRGCILLGKGYKLSLLYYVLNWLLGTSYLYLLRKESIRRVKNHHYEYATTEIQSCPICLVRVKIGHKIGKIRCGHVYHASCLNKWASFTALCPLCRDTLQSTETL